MTLRLLLLLALAACTPRPEVAWPSGTARAPDLLPVSDLANMAPASDPGPGVAARGEALRAWAAGGGRTTGPTGLY